MICVLPIDQSEIKPFNPADAKARRERLWKPAYRAANIDAPLAKVVRVDFRPDSDIGFIPLPVAVVVPAPVNPEPAPPPPSFAEAMAAYRVIARNRADPYPTSSMIIHDVAMAHGMTSEDIRGSSRIRRFAVARQHAYFILITEKKMTFPAVGRRFGGKDHTTVMWGVHAHQKRLDELGEVRP